MEAVSIKIVNMINENFSLNLLTVDSSRMTEEIKELLGKELPKPTKSAINKAVLSELKDILEDMQGVHPEYHKESVEEAISNLEDLTT